MEQEFIKKLYHAHRNTQAIPSPEAVCKMINRLLKLLFPELADRSYADIKEFEYEFQDFRITLYRLLKVALVNDEDKAEEVSQHFVDQLPLIHSILLKDAKAICQGDPAAESTTEVIRTYPGFFAVAIYRLAHSLYKSAVPLIPRILTEYAHTQTGIDIHPAAKIGHNFCIDHGTGIVIGETVEIGNHVKIYQGVTLGALSIKKEMAKTKRHPTIEDHVVIYAGATILGGETVIGHHSVIGGSVWITKGVPPHSRVYYRAERENVGNHPAETKVSKNSGKS